MKEHLQIVKAWEEALPSAQIALIKVVEIRGSSYRRPGARLLVVNGIAYGSISGGCLEAELISTVWDRTEQGPSLLTFDTTTEEAWGYGLGCRGIITVLIRRVGSRDPELEALRDHLTQRSVSALVTSLSPQDLGELVTDGERLGCEVTALAPGREAAIAGNFFVELLRPRTALNVFGAGFDALPLVSVANHLGWSTSVYDHRSSLLTPARFPPADNLVCTRATNLELKSDPFGAVVVMTHNFEQDRLLLDRLLDLEWAYLGVLGPKVRTFRLLNDLGRADRLASIQAPIGLDLGAETPEEIALAITAEILAVMNDRESGFLKNRSQPIHQGVSVV